MVKIPGFTAQLFLQETLYNKTGIFSQNFSKQVFVPIAAHHKQFENPKKAINPKHYIHYQNSGFAILKKLWFFHGKIAISHVIRKTPKLVMGACQLRKRKLMYLNFSRYCQCTMPFFFRSCHKVLKCCVGKSSTLRIMKN